MQEWLLPLASGACGAAIITLCSNIVMWKLNRKAALEDKEDSQLKALQEGQRVLLLDRIQYLCRCYIRDKEVDFDDRRRLHKMHDAYHALGGNGDLNTLMTAVDELPVK